jgi:peroxiredoxin family protein
MDERPLSIMLFSGTDDKLDAATVLAAGAAAMGREVILFLQYWALDAFRADAIRKDHGVSAEAGPEGAELLAKHAGGQHWSDVLVQVKDIGAVSIRACAKSMDMFGLEKDDLHPIVDRVEGVASFIRDAKGEIVFI